MLAHLVVLLFFFCTPAHAARVDLKVEAVDFDLSADLAYDVVAVLGRVRAYLEDEVGFPMRRDVPVRIRVVQDRATYQALARDAGMSVDTLGFYTRQSGGVVWLSHPKQVRSTIVHEAVHLLLRVAEIRMPRWAHEGLAETFESYRVEGNAIWLDLEPYKLQRIREDADRLGLTVSTILTATPDTWAALDVVSIWPDHTYGGVLTGFLLRSAPGRSVLLAIASLPQGKRSGPDLLDVVQRTYPGGLERLELDWRTWWQGRPAPLQIPVRGTSIDIGEPTAPACPGGILMRRGTETVCSSGG